MIAANRSGKIHFFALHAQKEGIMSGWKILMLFGTVIPTMSLFTKMNTSRTAKFALTVAQAIVNPNAKLRGAGGRTT